MATERAEPVERSLGEAGLLLLWPRHTQPSNCHGFACQGVTQAPGLWGRQVCGVTSPGPRELNRPGWLAPCPFWRWDSGQVFPLLMCHLRNLGRGGSGPDCLVSGRALPASSCRRPPERQASHPSSALPSCKRWKQ